MNKGRLLYCHWEHSMLPPGNSGDYRLATSPSITLKKYNILAGRKSRPLVHQVISHTHSHQRSLFHLSFTASKKGKIIDNYSYGDPGKLRKNNN